ncbi:hypothetical protein BU15DRAFT_64834 [Melanogaster broomeanus]|nr:hypothetical protein BU15DRAFT_64834 [Melanogaster broomeanus]
MLVVHPASLCDVCLDPYTISSEPANSPHAIACGHIFCLTCLRNLSPSACPLCRKTFQPDRVKKLHVAAPPELDAAAEEAVKGESNRLLQRVALVSGEDVPDDEIVEVVTEVEAWLSGHTTDPNSELGSRLLGWRHRWVAIHAGSIDMLSRIQILHHTKTRFSRSPRVSMPRYVPPSPLSRGTRLCKIKASETIVEFRRVRRELKNYRRNADPRLQDVSSHNREVSRLQAEIDSFRRDAQLRYRNTSNPLPPPPEPLPLERFPAFARPGGGDTADPLLGAVPYPPPPLRTKPAAATTNGHRTDTSHTGTSHIQHVLTSHITQPPIAPRPRHAEAPRLDQRSRRPAAQDGDGVDRHHERRPHPESSNMGLMKGDRISSPVQRRPSAWFVPFPPQLQAGQTNPLVEERRSDEERDVREVSRTVRTTSNGGSDMDSRPGVGARLVSAAAYVHGYGSGYDSGFRIASEPASFAPSPFGSDHTERARGFPVLESPDEAIGGLGLMGVPRQMSVGTVSTPDEDATPMNPARRLARRNTSQVVDTDRSSRRLGDHAPLDMSSSGASRRVPMQTINQVLGVRHATSEGPLRNGVNGIDSSATHRRVGDGVAEPLAADDDSPRSETTWGVSYTGRGDLDDNVTSEEGEDDERETPIVTGSLPGTSSDASVLGLITEDEDYSRHSKDTPALDDRRKIAQRVVLEGAIEQTNTVVMPHKPHIAEVLHSDGRRGVNASDITNALSLHFDASSSAHDYQGHTFSAPSPYPNTGSGPEILAPTPIVGGPNVIHLWANHISHYSGRLPFPSVTNVHEAPPMNIPLSLKPPFRSFPGVPSGPSSGDISPSPLLPPGIRQEFCYRETPRRSQVDEIDYAPEDEGDSRFRTARSLWCSCGAERGLPGRKDSPKYSAGLLYRAGVELKPLGTKKTMLHRGRRTACKNQDTGGASDAKRQDKVEGLEQRPRRRQGRREDSCSS